MSETLARRTAAVQRVERLVEAVGGPADLNEVVERGTMLWGDRRVLVDWMTGCNTYLAGATPISLVRLGRAAEVFAVVDEELSGGYA